MTLKYWQVLTLAGSLRAASMNRAMLDMAAACAPPGLHLESFDGLGDLPLFNPDLEANEPAAVARLREAIAAADAVLIASPEYAHGVSSVMKNALDWMVAHGVFVDKPVLLWNASPRASIALAALRETLSVMTADLVEGAELCLLIQSKDGQPPSNPDPAAMRRALDTLQQGLQRRQHSRLAGLVSAE
ncbi:NADPH-dependent FMN reductase [Paucibacter sp. AS339]|uniref:NADPH-dependent FMN reductase n=1 Tax=Paucibacter hankyongi TaxID=3133434 RepID=UPI00309694FF